MTTQKKKPKSKLAPAIGKPELIPATNVESAPGLDPDYTPGFVPGVVGNVGTMYTQNYYKMVTQAEKLSMQSGVYRRIMEIMRDNIHGYGFKPSISSDDPEMQPYEASMEKIIKNGFFGEVNKIDLNYPKWIYEELITGELCVPAFVNPANGFVELGYVPARWIRSVQLNARNVLDVLGVHVQEGDWVPKRNKLGGEMKYVGNDTPMKVIRFDRNYYETDAKGNVVKDPETGQDVLNENCMQLTGDCFYFRTGNLSGQERGQGDGFALADMVITLEQGIRDFLARYDAQAALVYDMLIKGASLKDIKDKYSKIKLPTGRVPFVHNEKVVLTLHSPSIKIEDLTSFIRTMVVLIAGAAGVPEFQMGDGSQTNVATAKEQAPAMYAKFVMRRKEFESQLRMIARFMIERANAMGQLYATDEETKQQGASVQLTQKQLQKININIDFLPFERNNMGELATAFKTLTETAIEAIDATLLSKKAAGQTVRGALSQLGVKLDEAAEEAQIKMEQAEKAGMSQSGVSPTGQLVNFTDVSSTKIKNAQQASAVPNAESGRKRKAVRRKAVKA